MPAYGKVKVDTITYDLSGTATDVSVSNIATKASPTFTGTVTVPTASAGDNSTKAASTAFVATSFAPLASPTFTGSPTVPGYAALTGATFTGTVNGTSLVLSADLTVNGTTTTINTTTLQVEDKNIEIGKVSTPSDVTADGGGLTLLGATNKTWNWVNSTDAWTSSEHIHLGDNKELKLGTAQDLKIWHDGTNSRIAGSTGATLLYSTNDDLYLEGADDVFIQVQGGETALRAFGNGQVELYYDNNKKIETTSSGINVTGQINVNGSALSAAPQITGTASGAIADKAAIIVKSDGNLASVVGTSASLGSETAINSDTSSYPFEMVFDSTNNKVVISNYGSGADFHTYVGTVSGTSISWGSMVEISNSLNENGTCVYCEHNDSIVYAWTLGNSNRDLGCRVGEISGTSISLSSGGETEIANSSAAGQYPKIYPNLAYSESTDKVICFYISGTKLLYSIGTFSGSAGALTVGWSSGAYLYNGSTSSNGVPAADNVNHKIFHVWRKDTTSPGHGIITCGTISGNTFTFASDVTFTDTNDNIVYPSVTYSPDDDKILILWQASNGDIKYAVGQAAGSSTTVSLGSEQTLYSGSDAEWPRACYDSTNKKITVRYSVTTGSDVLYLVQGSFASGNNITWETAQTYNNGSRMAFGSVAHDSNAGKIVTAFRDDGDSGHANSLVWSPASTNINSENFVGFADGAVSNGQTATVNVVGNTVTKSSLTPGKTYYVQNDGSLGTTAATPSVEAGLALTSSSLLIKG